MEGFIVNIECPECRYSAGVDPLLIPRNTKTLKCPECRESFRISDELAEIVGDNPEKTTTSADPESPHSNKAKPVFHGNGTTLFSVYIMNYLKTLLTLGVYYFWGKTRVRNYLYSQSEFMGERFSYLGTGMELFTGWLKAFVIILIFFIGPQLLAEFVHPAYIIIVYVSMLIFIPIAMVGTRRYRLSRSRWHGVRFSFRGTFKEGLKVFIKGYLLTLITLGIYAPFFHVDMQRFWRGNSYYGNLGFNYTGDGKDLLKYYLVVFVLFLPTMGLSWVWYKARKTRYDWENTTLGGNEDGSQTLKFSSELTGERLLGFLLINLLLLVLTLGLAFAWIEVRKMNFAFEFIDTKGSVDFEKVREKAQEADAMGEGLLDAFDMDFGF
ncbi:MAG: DUF898 family protein [Deltaproteobacteria bacterium]|nr:DUF898 family protein [Deltaproteobacteria bacterium]